MKSLFQKLLHPAMLIVMFLTLILVQCGLKSLTVTVPKQAKAGQQVT
ncbi:hypothetical protein L950_0208075 [Sphingobacterium sp. IITKGP-BTPF85]|nr:hypothetical protein L950_0208075 [Sphingobacterium sp. IITKGP-BTPF85]